MNSSAIFNTAIECDLIDMVQEQRLLWDVRHPFYHRRDFKEKAYADIATVLGNGITGESENTAFLHCSPSALSKYFCVMLLPAFKQ